MRKIIFFLSLIVFGLNLQAQNYSTQTYLETAIGKDDQGIAKKDIELKATGEYDWFYYHFSHRQPFKKSANPADLEKLTLMAAGYAKHLEFGQDFVLHGGIGPCVGITPQVNSVPKKNNIFIGGIVSINISSEEKGMEAETYLGYLSMMSSSNYDWTKGLFTGELKLKKSFGKVVAVGVGYKMESSTTTEKQLPNVQFMNTSYSNAENEFNPFVSLGSKNFKFEVGPVFRWKKYSYNQIDANTGMYIQNWNRSNWPTGFKIRLAMNFEQFE